MLFAVISCSWLRTHLIIRANLENFSKEWNGVYGFLCGTSSLQIVNITNDYV